MNLDWPRRRRKGISGILAAVFFFAILFTAGVSFTISTLGFYHQTDQARDQEVLLSQQKAAENVTLGPAAIQTGCHSSCMIYMNVTNTGGVPVTFVKEWATDSSGQLIGESLRSPSYPTFPYNLSVGASLFALTGQLLNTGVTTAAGALPITVGLVTQRGNVFTAVYPPPSTTTTVNQIQVQMTETNNVKCVSGDINCVPVSAFGVEYLEFDFSTFIYYSGMNGATACNVPGYPNGCKLAPVGNAYSVYEGSLTPSGCSSRPSTCFIAFGINVTNVDPTHRSIYLQSLSMLVFLTAPGGNGKQAMDGFEWGLGNVSKSLQVQAFPSVGIRLGYGFSTRLYFIAESAKGIPTLPLSGPQAMTSFALVYGTERCASGDQNCSGDPIPFGLNVNFVMSAWYPGKTVTLATALSAATIAKGGSVYDTATLSGATADAGGTVTYYYYAGSYCSGTGTQVGQPKTVTNGVIPNSDSLTFNVAGLYSWEAVYSGDAKNAGTASPCEPLYVTQAAVQVVTLTVAESGAPTASFTVTTATPGCSVSPGSIPGDGTPQSITVAGPPPSSCVITLTAPPPGTNTRFVLSGGASSQGVSVNCDTGTCSADLVPYYYQLDNTYKATPTSNGNKWDAVINVPVNGTIAGVVGQTGCTMVTSVGGGADTCTAWFDYNTQVTVISPLMVSGTERWLATSCSVSTGAPACTSPNVFTHTGSGGYTNNVNYVRQWLNAYQVTAAGLQVTFANVLTWPITGQVAGVPSQTVCTITSAPGDSTDSCSAWADDSSVSFPTAPGGSPQYTRRVASGTTSFSPTSGGNTFTVAYYKQLQNSYSAVPANRGGVWDKGGSITVSGTLLGSPGTVCTITTTNGGGPASCTNVWSDYGQQVNMGVLTVTAGKEQWAPPSSPITVTTGGNSYQVNYYDQLQNTYAASPTSNNNHWDAVLNIPVTGTVAGAAGQTGCTITTVSGGGSANCPAWFDYNTQVTVAPTITVSPGTEQWSASSANTFTQTTGGATDTVSYVRQWSVTFSSAGTGAGTLTVNGASVAWGSSVWMTDNVPISIVATPAAGHSFVQWTATGTITIANANSASTTATVKSTGTITATFT